MNKATVLISEKLSEKEKFKAIFKCKYAYFIKNEIEFKDLVKRLKENCEVITLLNPPKFSFEGLRDYIKEKKREGVKFAIVYKSFSPFQIYPFEWIGDYALFPLKGFISGSEKTRGYVFLSKEEYFKNLETDFPSMPYLETVEARRKLAEQTTLFLIRKIDGFKSIFKGIYYPYLTDKKNAKSFLKSQGNVFSIKFESIDIAEKFMQSLSFFERENFVYGQNRSCVRRYRNYLIFSIGLESVNDLEKDIRQAKLNLR